MKFRILAVALLLVGSSMLIIGCPSNNSPSTPAAPTPTDTTCANAQGTPCTSTFTATPTNTATNTATGTPTNTATFTDTRTPTGTPTNTRTSTPTFTVTNTATDSPTATITQTPTDTGTPTQTGTPTNTFQFSPTSTPTSTATSTPSGTSTGSPTATPTATSTSCPNQPTPTATVSTTNGVAMRVTYSGTGTVSSSNPIYVFVTDSFGGSSTFQAVRYIDSNGGSVTIYGMNNGTYYLAMFYNAVGDGHFYQGSGGVSPHVGDQAQFYGVPAGNCNPSGATALSVNGGINNLGSISFTGGSLWGFAGTLTYNGSVGGTVSNCNPICVAYYTDSGYTSLQTNKSYTTNGVRYDMDTFSIGGACSSASAYVQAWYAKSGNTSSPQVGDPVTQLGLVSNASSASLNITIP